MSDDPFAPFRSRRARVVTLTLGAVAVLVFAAVAVGLYVSSGRPDALLLVVFGLAVAAVCWRYASISAIPDREGILVRNLLLTRRSPGQRSSVSTMAAERSTLATLVLDDGDALAIMAIQRADGPSAQAEASRLAALVQALADAAGRAGPQRAQRRCSGIGAEHQVGLLPRPVRAEERRLPPGPALPVRGEGVPVARQPTAHPLIVAGLDEDADGGIPPRRSRRWNRSLDDEKGRGADGAGLAPPAALPVPDAVARPRPRGPGARAPGRSAGRPPRRARPSQGRCGPYGPPHTRVRHRPRASVVFPSRPGRRWR